MNLMIDLETMGTSPNSPILQIGAVIFDADKMYETFMEYIRPNFNLCKPDIETLIWWSEQDAPMPLNPDGVSYPEMIQRLKTWMHGVNITHVWANSPSFDLVIMEAQARAYDITLPFKFYQYRDCRTAAAVAPGAARPMAVVKHDALADAVSQARWMMNIHEVVPILI